MDVSAQRTQVHVTKLLATESSLQKNKNKGNQAVNIKLEAFKKKQEDVQLIRQGCPTDFIIQKKFVKNTTIESLSSNSNSIAAC